MLRVFIVDHEPSIVAFVYIILEDDWVRSSGRPTSTSRSGRRFQGSTTAARSQVEDVRGGSTAWGSHTTRFDGPPVEVWRAGEGARETFNGVREPDAPYQVVPLPGHPHEGGRTTAVASGAGRVSGRPAERLRTEALRQQPDARLRQGWERAAVRRVLRRAGVSDFVGEGPGIQAVLARVLQIAPSDARVVILGESGTGKGLLARTIHALSRRRAKPFVDVHCGAVATPLLESELFGHERGAFTGAVADKRGLLELADGGTLFLDEFAEMTPDMQTKLLKVLDHGEFRRVGGVRTMTVAVRVLVATNRNLDELVRTGRVRMDLLHRIDVVRITLPPLRHRPEDVPRFVAHFMALHRRRGLGAKTVTPQALRVMQEYPWPGNVRELANAVERLMILAPGPTIDVDDLPEGLPTGQTELRVPVDDLALTLEEVERRHILHVLDTVKGNRAAAARWLGLERTTLQRKLKRWERANPSEART